MSVILNLYSNWSYIMTPHSRQLLKSVLDLSPVERAEMVEQILASFGFPMRSDIDHAWAREVEDRIDAFERGDIGSTPASEVFKDINHRAN